MTLQILRVVLVLSTGCQLALTVITYKHSNMYIEALGVQWQELQYCCLCLVFSRVYYC